MNIFGKKPQPQHEQQPEHPEQKANIHAPAPASDAQNLMGGLGWYRSQFRNAMKLVLFMIAALCIALGIIA